MMLIQLFREAQKRLPIFRMGVRMNGEGCMPSRLASHSVVEGRSGDQIGAVVVSIDDRRSCLGRKNCNLTASSYLLIPAFLIPAFRVGANRLAGGQSLGTS